MGVLLAGGIIAFVVVFVILFSNASFTQSSHSKGNSFTAGGASLSLSKTGPIVDATDMQPGQSRTGDITVTNTGNAGPLSVSATGIATAPVLASVLRLKITPQGQPSNVLYDGTFAGASGIALGNLGGGQAGAFTFEITLPLSIDPSLAGVQLNASFEWEIRTS
jgi:hypothetical protein